jgi:hypothetical protein
MISIFHYISFTIVNTYIYHCYYEAFNFSITIVIFNSPISRYSFSYLTVKIDLNC